MITFSWNSVPNATAYSVAWAPTLSGNKKILVASQAETSYSFDGSHVDDPYYVNRDTYMFVRALDGSDYVSSDWASVVMQMREVSIAGSHVSSTLAIGDYRVVVGTVVPSFTITPDKGYQLTAEDISIVNNGVDITSQVYNANTHTVSSFVVNGSVQVLATAVQAQLAAPVISLSGSVVSWAAVPDAESYKLYVDGQFTANLGNELSVDLSQVIALKVPYTVNVLAHARGFKDSELSNTISYTPKPDAPVLTLNGSILSWTAIPSATKYTLVATSNSLSLSKTKDVDANTTSLDLTTWTDLVPSSWIIGAIAYVGDVRSDTSATVTYVNTVQLAAPTTVNINGNVLTWNNVANNSGYEILYRRTDSAGEIYQTDMVETNVTQHTLTVTTAGTYSVTIVTIGTGSYTDSAESAAVTYTIQNKLATPTIAIEGDTLKITDVESAQRYKIYANGELKTTILKAVQAFTLTLNYAKITDARFTHGRVKIGSAPTSDDDYDYQAVNGHIENKAGSNLGTTVTVENVLKYYTWTAWGTPGSTDWQIPVEHTEQSYDLCYAVCLTGDTLVTMADNSVKRLDMIELGDYVLSFDFDSKMLIPRKVIYTDKNEMKSHTEYDKWTFEDGTEIKTVHRHEFYNLEAQRMKYMDEWSVGEHAYKIDGTMPKLISHKIVEETVRHYKITLEGSTNYFANGLLTGDRNCPKNITLNILCNEKGE